MMGCGVCGEEIEENWSYCPFCGSALAGESEAVDRLEKIRYMWERKEGGKFIYENFPAVRRVGIYPYQKTEPFRKELGDWAHILFSCLKKYSFLYLRPDYISEMYKIGKLLGYYSAEEAFRTLKLPTSIKLLNKPRLVLEAFHNDIVFETQKKGWENLEEALLEKEKIDKEQKKIIYKLKDIPESIFQTESPIHFIHAGVLSGNAETISSGFWDGTQIRNSGSQESIRIEIKYHEKEQKPPVKQIKQKDLENIMGQITWKIIDREENLRQKLGDYVHISGEQCINYLLTIPSPGHRIISKQSGIVSGQMIAEKANLRKTKKALKYLQDLFLYLRIGILEEPSLEKNRIFIEMKESVYASGAENIHTRLCTFLAGIMEGVLKEATGEKWIIQEQYCQAMGRSKCGFSGKKR